MPVTRHPSKRQLEFRGRLLSWRGLYECCPAVNPRFLLSIMLLSRAREVLCGLNLYAR